MEIRLRPLARGIVAVIFVLAVIAVVLVLLFGRPLEQARLQVADDDLGCLGSHSGSG